ncbi:MAG: AAA family ATPase [Bacteroidota bacterium]
MPSAIELILQPYTEGKSCVIVQGRSLYDLELNDKGQIQPLIELLRNQALIKHHLVLVQYSRSTGVVCDITDLNHQERSIVNKALSDFGIQNNNRQRAIGDDSEFITILRALLRLGQQSSPLMLGENIPLRFLILIEFPEHLLPHLNNGTHTPEQIIAIELAMRLSNSLAFRKSQNYTVLAEVRSGLMESLIYQNIDSVSIPQPNVAAKVIFIESLKNRYPQAKEEQALNTVSIANLSSGTPNRSLESIYLSSEKTGHAINAHDVFSRKQSDIVSLSEGTLELIDHNRVKNTKVVGRTIQKPLQLLTGIANRLKRNDPNTPRNILLCGSPSGGKTILTLIAAAQASVPTFSIVNPKSQWVGESERKAKLMLSLLRELGGIGLIDELEMQLPMNRNQSTYDSGVTQNLIGQLQSFLADTSTAGKVCLIGTSNKPEAISEAMRQRWIVVPVLMPLQQDFPEIVLSIASELNPQLDVKKDSSSLNSASERFYRAGAAPREIREALIAAQAVIAGDLCEKQIEFASHDIIPNSDQTASHYADYVALSYCRNNSFLPWWDEKENHPDPLFPFPDYIKEVLRDDFLLDPLKLRKRISELGPYANV